MRSPGTLDDVGDETAADETALPDGPRATQRIVRDRPFALRLQKACDENSRVPAYNHGRQAWIRTQLAEQFDARVSNETVSKWFTGVARPRPDKVNLLAELLEVDEAWLALGASADIAPRERKVRNAMADGVVNVLAGFVQMCGGHAAFPEPGDATKGGARVDLYAIIKGAHYSFQVALARNIAPDTYHFTVGYGHENRVIIGVIQRKPLVCDFLELRADLIQTLGVRRSGNIEITVEHQQNRYVTEGQAWPQISTFAERI